MSWVEVPCLVEGRDQLDARFPNREHGAEGFVGDLAHQGSASSHNPDKTGKPEFADGDSKDEVRAWDADRDLHDSKVIMEDVVQHVIEGARAGKFWWIRYIIYKKRIWHRKDGFVTRSYTGSNPHEDHAHFNSDFTQAADDATGTNWEFNAIGEGSSPAPAPGSSDDSHVVKKGAKGEEVGWIQSFLRVTFPSYRNNVAIKRGTLIAVDKDFGLQTEAWVKEFQRRTGVGRDGEVGPITRAQMRRFGYTH